MVSMTSLNMVANPVPESHEIPADELTDIITQALAEAQENAVTGKAVTPFLLDRIRQKTDGRTLATNQALVMNNAKIAAQIACAYAAL